MASWDRRLFLPTVSILQRRRLRYQHKMIPCSISLFLCLLKRTKTNRADHGRIFATQMVGRTGSGISHCPNSNFSLKSGVCNVQRLRRAGVKVSNSDARFIAGFNFSVYVWDEHDQLSRWVLERTVLEDSRPPFWTQCVKQLLLQMLYTSPERRTLHFHLGWLFLFLPLAIVPTLQRCALPGDQRQRKSSCQRGRTGPLGGGCGR